ncbi:UDP-N-acetylmuramate dehydrogenase [bacterium]|nr:UDP-N-acetylmuramate dehydrogenase [bacterium]
MDEQTKQFQRIRQVVRGKLLVDEPLSKHTYFRIGGPADYYFCPKDLEDLSAIVDYCQREDVAQFIIGNGSNLLVSDEGYRGVVIDLSETFTHIHSKGYVVTVGAGVQLKTLLHYCTERGLSGLEHLVGIPAQIGGALNLNAGAYGGEIYQHVQSIHLLDKYATLELRKREDITAGYRETDLPSDSIVIEAQFLLAEGNPKEMEALQEMHMKERRDKQPLSLPSAGSVFKRPPGDYAGRLIEEAGCKGFRIGDAMVSKKHANFIVNCHLASARDVLRLIDEIKQRVFNRFDIMLELEIHLIGFKEK